MIKRSIDLKYALQDSLSKPRSLYIDSLSKSGQPASGIIDNCSEYFFIEILLWVDLCS